MKSMTVPTPGRTQALLVLGKRENVGRDAKISLKEVRRER